MPQHVAFVIMARYPIVGSVKTRLARTIGAERACLVYQAFLRDLDDRFARRSRALIWAFHPPESNFPSLVAPGTRCVPQVGQGLGARMHGCFRLLGAEGFDKVILIGADVPHVREQWLDEAEAALDSADVVLGPTADGGYYLIAMREPHDIFTGIEMSTPRVLAETLATAAAARLRVHLVPPTFDVDDADDLARLRELLAADGCKPQLPHTAALLKSWGGDIV
ncbi:MAG: TIGR04282 family arsenosugar biosynthesis glycosyltransferase [Candidatus Binatia bacterium]